MKRKIIVITAILLLQSCATIPQHLRNPVCSRIDDELNLRYYLFDKLDDKEISRRQKINVPTYVSDDISVTGELIKSIYKASRGAKIIPVDLRYYRDVGLGNLIITNYPTDQRLNLALKTTKYSQGFFVLVNFGLDGITLVTFPDDKSLKRKKIYRSDLQDVEVLMNVSDSRWIIGNMKFTPNQKFSLLADRVAMPYSLDLRENSNVQFHLGEKWIMPVYSIEENEIMGGKDTAGFFQFVNNYKTKRINITKFNDSQVMCYKDDKGPKF